MSICHASKLQALINETPDGEVLRLEPKSYFLSDRLVIKGRKHLTIDGNGATFITKYENVMPEVSYSDAILIEHCEHITIKNMTITTDSPVNFSATVESFDPEEGTFTLKVDDYFPITGNEVFLVMDSMDEEGSPDRNLDLFFRNPDPSKIKLLENEIICFSNLIGPRYQYLGDHRFLFSLSDLESSKSPVILPGARIAIRSTAYGPSLITLRHSNDTILKDISMPSVPGFGIMVLTRCHNLTVDGLTMSIEDPSHTYMSGNCDGLHIVGLTGKFIMKNCFFDGLGDDALNIHSTAGTVTGMDSAHHTFTCNYCKKTPDGSLPDSWCREGDLLRFYDPRSLEVTATAVAVDFKQDQLSYRDLKGCFRIGDMVQNTAYTASCEIEHCTVRNSRARGFLIQTEQVEIKNCSFFGTASSAIKGAPAFERWYEVGPLRDFHVHHNTFTKCGYISPDTPAIAVFTRHSGNDETITGLHRDLRIEDNHFDRGEGIFIGVSASDRVCIAGNRFAGRPESQLPTIQVISSRDVTLSDNEEI